MYYLIIKISFILMLSMAINAESEYPFVKVNKKLFVSILNNKIINKKNLFQGKFE